MHIPSVTLYSLYILHNLLHVYTVCTYVNTNKHCSPQCSSPDGFSQPHNTLALMPLLTIFFIMFYIFSRLFLHKIIKHQSIIVPNDALASTNSLKYSSSQQDIFEKCIFLKLGTKHLLSWEHNQPCWLMMMRCNLTQKGTR